MEKVIHKLINEFTEGVDTYTHNGSTWLIFTDTKQWVIELTEEKTLWYNYNFFKGMFAYTSMDVVENQHYITKWVEDNIINKVKDTILERNITEGEVEEIIENGVKETSSNVMMFQSMKVEDTIQNGVRHTIATRQIFYIGVEDTIQNGVRHTITSENRSRLTAENIIENGVKLTNKSLQTDGSCVIEDTIQNGVRHTEIGWHQCNNIDDAIEKGVKEIYDYKGHRWDVRDVIQDGVRDISPMTQYTDWQVEEIIENGVKETLRASYLNVDNVIQDGVKEIFSYDEKHPLSYEQGVKKLVDDTIKKGVRHTLNTEYMPNVMVEDTIQNGVKHTEYGDWLDGDERLDDIVENGVKKTSLKRGTRPFMVKDTIKNGVKETHDDVYHHKGRIDGVIKNGVKETKGHGFEQQNIIDDIVKDGVKETKTPGKDGDILSTIEWMKENKSNSYTKMIDDVIDYGEKINGTYSGGQRQSIKCKSVVEYGTKNPTD